MITQTNQVEELAYISQPKKYANGVGADMMQVKGRYSWDQTSGAGVTIYMVDTVGRVLFPSNGRCSLTGGKGAYQFHEVRAVRTN